MQQFEGLTQIGNESVATAETMRPAKPNDHRAGYGYSELGILFKGLITMVLSL
ncbi:hypothetical protein [Prevotella sp.]|uniref:hypothetical protein n=1 Tax=Prevotella sp. TaxID=59823 RepID=UPI002F955311